MMSTPRPPGHDSVGSIVLGIKLLTILTCFRLTSNVTYSFVVKKQVKILTKECGPLWYVEMASFQKAILKDLIKNIHYDLIESQPSRTRRALHDLGVVRNIPNSILMKNMTENGEDAAVFIWNLYTDVFKHKPSQRQKEYDMDAMILLSSLACIDLEECIEQLNILMKPADKKPPVKKPRRKKVDEFDLKKDRYAMYLGPRIKVPLVCNYGPPPHLQEVKEPPPHMDKKITLRSDNLDKRLQRNVKAKAADRICTYKFWEPPVHLLCRGNDPKEAEYYQKLKLVNKPAKVCHSTDYKNIQFHVGHVALIGGKTRYLLNNICVLPTGYIYLNAGTVAVKTGELLTLIGGSWRFPMLKEEKCDETCDCMKWEKAVMDRIEKTKCKCAHLYDYQHEGKSMEKYFYPPTKMWPMWFDEAKVFSMDPVEDFIKESINLAVRSKEPTPEPSHPELSAGGMKTKDLLHSFLADLSNTALVIPHLPQAECLMCLLEIVRKRFAGKLLPECHKHALVTSFRRWLWLKHLDFRERAFMIPFTKKELEELNWADRRNLQYLPEPSHPELSAGGMKTKDLLHSFLADLSNTALVIPHLPQAECLMCLLEIVRKRFAGKLLPECHKHALVTSFRRWLWLKHLDFRERAFMIPFTKKELEELNWADRRNLQYLFETLLAEFTKRNQLRALEQTRLWWGTMKYDRYPGQAFLDLFFTYMPGRMKDTLVLNPYNSERTPFGIYKTCPL